MKISESHERVLVFLVALHSIIIGIMLFVFPGWAARFAGFDGIEPLFFGRQAGVFHLALAAGYLIEYFKYRGVTLIVTAKTIAVVFLLLSWLVEPLPWAVPVSGFGDGAMAALVWWVHRAVRPSRAR